VNEGGVETPCEPLGEGGRGHLGCPVIVCGVAIAGKAVLGERLHQPIELRSESTLTEVRAGIDQMSFSLPPLCPPVLEPDLNFEVGFGISIARGIPNSGLCEVGPHRNLLSGRHIWISVSGKKSFQLLQLLRGEMGSLSSLSFFLSILIQGVVLAVCNLTALAGGFTRVRLYFDCGGGKVRGGAGREGGVHCG